MLQEAGRDLDVRVSVSAGTHTIAHCVRQMVEEEGIPQPRQGGRLLANDEAYLDYQKVHSIEIGGPFITSGQISNSSSRQFIFSCYPIASSEELSCASEILSPIARKAYRRAITSEDISQLLDFFREGREQGGSFDHGIQFALEYLLSDPEFLIRSYQSPPDLRPDENFRISDIDLASRLSFFLWSSAPDEELLALAEQGSLSDPKIFEQQVMRLLTDDRGIDTIVEDFSAQWLNLRRLEEVNINTVLFPEYDVSLIEAFEKETKLFIASTLREDTSILELIGADYTFVNERLARHYGIDNVNGSRFRRTRIPDTEKRGGLLAQGALLTVTSYPGRTSPVLRGKWLLDNMLGTPPAPAAMCPY